MEINEKRIRSITINEAKKAVTVVADDMVKVSTNGLNNVIRMLGGEAEDVDTKVVGMSKAVGDDAFDKYVGVALALAYVAFGSKTKFHKYVDSIQIKNPVEKKEEVNKATKEVKNYKDPEESLCDNYTLQELRDMAKERGLKGYSRLTKSELVNLIVESFII